MRRTQPPMGPRHGSSTALPLCISELVDNLQPPVQWLLSGNGQEQAARWTQSWLHEHLDEVLDYLVARGGRAIAYADAGELMTELGPVELDDAGQAMYESGNAHGAPRVRLHGQPVLLVARVVSWRRARLRLPL